jgi:hypothetical protein
MCFALAVVAVVAGGPVPARGQTGGASLDVLRIDSSGYPTVTAQVAVPMVLSGRSLDSADFQVREGDEVRDATVQRLDLSQLEVVVILDSSLRGPSFLAAQGALLEVPVHLVGPTLTVLRTGNPTTVLLPPTTDGTAASTAIESFAPADGAAEISGLSRALDELPPPAGRRAILIMTSASTENSFEVTSRIDRAAADGTSVYVIGVGSSVPASIRRSAQDSGGAAFPVRTPTIVPAIDAMIADLVGQYDVTATLRNKIPGTPISLVVSAMGITAEAPLVLDDLRGRSNLVAAPSGLRHIDDAGLPSVLILLAVVGVLLLLLSVVGVILPGNRPPAGDPGAG